MRDEDRVRILHMIDAADAVAQFVAGRRREELEQDLHDHLRPNPAKSFG